MRNISEKMNKIYYVGGAKGVGKTTLLTDIAKEKGLQIVNTGSFFYVKQPKKIIKATVVNHLIKNTPLIADTHYAGFIDGEYSGKYERTLYVDELALLAENSDLELILVEIDPEKLFSRRSLATNKKRNLNIEHVRAELRYNRKYFHDYCEQLSQQGFIINNNDFEEAKKKLASIF